MLLIVGSWQVDVQGSEGKGGRQKTEDRCEANGRIFFIIGNIKSNDYTASALQLLIASFHLTSNSVKN